MTRVLESAPATSNSEHGPLLSKHLAKLRQNGIRHRINGSEVASTSGRTFENRSPIDNSVIAEVARGDESDVDRAAQAAKRAFKDWRNLNPDKRQTLLHKVADVIEAHAEEIADIGKFRHRPTDPVHVEGSHPVGREFSLLRRSRSPKRATA